MTASEYQITYAKAINEAISQAMRDDESVICYGLGVTDPKGVFGTTLGLEAHFGSERVFDMPTSENALTGVAIGAALAGLKPIMTHQRLDFCLLAMDQLVNGAAKWRYMFGGQHSVPITIRLIVGRGWGQGPTHSQSLQAWFAHIPGLKVLMPTTPYDAKLLLYSAILDPDPVIFLEHRWLHGAIGYVPEEATIRKLGSAKVVHSGKDITVISLSYLTVEALRVAKFLADKDVSVEVIDLISIKPIDWQTIYISVEKTSRILVLDTGFTTGSVAGEIITRITTERFHSLRAPPKRLAMPDCPEPTSYGLTSGFYIDFEAILNAIVSILDLKVAFRSIEDSGPHDIPGKWFSGPF
jgi:pyruvate/2-oxoglutarate/acetoin dehydrogenase E1 component